METSYFCGAFKPFDRLNMALRQLMGAVEAPCPTMLGLCPFMVTSKSIECSWGLGGFTLKTNFHGNLNLLIKGGHWATCIQGNHKWGYAKEIDIRIHHSHLFFYCHTPHARLSSSPRSKEHFLHHPQVNKRAYRRTKWHFLKGVGYHLPINILQDDNHVLLFDKSQ